MRPDVGELAREAVRRLDPGLASPGAVESGLASPGTVEPGLASPRAVEPGLAESGLVDLRGNENPFGGRYRHYPDDDPAGLAEQYLAALDAVEPAPTAHAAGDPAQVLLTRGAVDALDLVLRTFFVPGADAVAVTPPSPGCFDRLATLHGLALHRVPLAGDGYDRLDVERLAAVPVGGIILCDPNNPSSTSLQPGELGRLLTHFAGLVIVDETYVELAGRASHRHLIAGHPNLIVLRSLSQGFGLAGLRLGAALAARPLIAAMRQARAPSATTAPSAIPVPVAAIAAQELGDPATLRQRIAAFVAERDHLAADVAGCPLVSRVYAAAGFVTVDVDDIGRVATALRTAGIAAVVNPDGWQGRVRISVGTRAENEQLTAALYRAGVPATAVM